GSSPTCAAQLHPAAGKGIAVVTEATHPWRTGGGWRRQHECAAVEFLVVDLADRQCARQSYTCIAIGAIQWFDCAVADNRTDISIQLVQNALSLAEGVAEQHTAALVVCIASPPLIDVSENSGLWLPTINRQAEGRLG